jgi:hypothetical protein
MAITAAFAFQRATSSGGIDLVETVIKAAIGVGVAQLIVGAALLVGWYYVQKRFTEHEFPAVVQRMTAQVAHLEDFVRSEFLSVRADINGARSDIQSHGRELARHDERLGHHARRLDRLEDRADGGNERRRERDLDDTRAGR